MLESAPVMAQPDRPTLLNLQDNRLAAEILFQCAKFIYERGKPITLNELVEECIKSGHTKRGSIKATAARLKNKNGYFKEGTNYYRPGAVISNPRTAKLAMEIDEADEHRVDEVQFLQRTRTEYVWINGDAPNKHIEFLVNQGYCEKRDDGSVQTTHGSRFGMEVTLIERIAKLDSDGNFDVELKDLMPQAANLLGIENPFFPKTKELLKHIDANLVSSGVFRSEWTIDIRYDAGRLLSDGIIRESQDWTYKLTNTSKSPTKHNLTLMNAPDLQQKVGDSSFYEFTGSSAKSLLPEHASETGVFANRNSEIEFYPLETRLLGMSYSLDWPVSREHPIIHNCFAPKEVAFGQTRLKIYAPTAKKVGVLFNNLELHRALDERLSSPDIYVFTIPGPILQGQVLELLVIFQPTSVTKVGKSKRRRRSAQRHSLKR